MAEKLLDEECIAALVQKHVDSAYPDGGPLVSASNQGIDCLQFTINYGIQVLMSYSDIRIKVLSAKDDDEANRVIGRFIKRSISEALTRLSGLILDKIKELDTE